MSEEMQVPRSALNVTADSDSCFEMFAEEDKKQRWRMVANSGGVIENHPHWGNFAIDLAGLKIGRQRKPALRDHSPKAIVGATSKIEVTEEGLVAEGTFADTPDGREVSSMLADGFPWQASVYVPPKKIEKLAEGESAEVNGYTIHGPGHIFRSSSLREVTFTSLGADENTHAAAFTDQITIHAVFTANKEEVSMNESTEPVEEVTVTTSKDSHQNESPEISVDKFGYLEGVEEGIKQERDRISALFEASSPDQKELVSDMILTGTKPLDGMKALLSDHQSRVEQRLAHNLAATPEPVGPENTETNDPRSAFESNPQLTAEFGSWEVYEAYTKADEAGSIRGRIS